MSLKAVGILSRRPPRHVAAIEFAVEGAQHPLRIASGETAFYRPVPALRIIYDKLGLWNRVEPALWFEKR